MAVSSQLPGHYASGQPFSGSPLFVNYGSGNSGSTAETICKLIDSDLTDLTKLHELNPRRYPFLLQSIACAAGHGSAPSQISRYDILFAFPAETLKKLADGSCIHSEKGRLQGDFLDLLDQHWQTGKTAPSTRSLPFTGGWFLYLGYELAGEIEPNLKLPVPNQDLPVACAVRIPAAVILDRVTNQLWLVAEKDHADLLIELESDVGLAAEMAITPDLVNLNESDVVNLDEDNPDDYLNAVQRIKEYIYEGDVFQVNLSRKWTHTPVVNRDAIELYRNLCRSNPAPFAGIARFDQVAVISSSPERLVRTQGLQIDTRPIAGTRPRSGDNVSDQALSDELLAHPKEQAEHIMLIDLERNDLGRVSQPGSIQVNELMGLESYAHVHHIVSNVRGKLIAGTTPGQVIRAVFPGGTITGCPKVRCMEIIAELEQTARGAYTGSMGYLNNNGDMDLNILIRTLVQTPDTISCRAGAGIVADSEAQLELAETRAKARGLLIAINGTRA